MKRLLPYLTFLVISPSWGCSDEPVAVTFEPGVRLPLELEEGHVVGRAMDLARDAGGRFYVVDAFEHTVWVIDSAGREVGAIGREGDGPGELEEPVSAAIAGDTLAVLEAGNARISFFALPEGTFVRTIPQHGPMPSGIELEPGGGKIAVSHSYGEDLVSILDRSGEVVTTFGTHPVAPFVVPVKLPGGHMSRADDGRLLVSAIRDYEVLRTAWTGEVAARYVEEPAGFQPMDLASASSRSDVEERVRAWTPVGLPLDYGDGVMVQWSEPVPVEGSGRLDYRGYADLYTHDGELVAARIEKPCLFALREGDLLYCLDTGEADDPDRAGPAIAAYRMIHGR